MDPLEPPQVSRALERYRALLAGHGMSWGEPLSPYVKSMSLSRFSGDPAVLSGDDAALRDALAGCPDGLAILRLTGGGQTGEVRGDDACALDGRVRTVLDGRPLPLAVLVDNRRAHAVQVRGAEHISGADGVHETEVEPGGARLVEADTSATLTVDGQPVELRGLARSRPAAVLRLRAGLPCRWSVVSGDGGTEDQGWYPDGAPRRRDFNGLPYFHGDDVVVAVPEGEPVTIRVTRGMEYGFATATITPTGETIVDLKPERLYDAAAQGWYGADLHAHLNFTGDLVATPAMAAAAQHGEDLHVLNLLAANVAGRRIYDQEALEHWAGRDLPWSDGIHIARMGVEYRNDLFGHLHAFGPVAAPARYHSGFADAPDWPPNSVACGEFRGLGAIVGYAHGVGREVAEPADVTREGGSIRAAVVDAALGLIDSMEVLHYRSATGSAEVYRRLIGAGNRLACVAGSDAMLSLTRQRVEMVASPPGWVRTYARVEGLLTAESYAEAVRLARTFATTGPFLDLTVNGRHGPGERLAAARATVRCRVIGPEVERLTLRTAAGVLATGEGTEMQATFDVTEPTYVVAVAEGGPHARSLYPRVFAHTSPVWLDVAGRGVARAEDVQWCLRWLDLLEDVVAQRAVLRREHQLEDHLDLIVQARQVYRRRLNSSG